MTATQKELLKAQAYVFMAWDLLKGKGQDGLQDGACQLIIRMGEGMNDRIENNPYIDAIAHGKPMESAEGEVNRLLDLLADLDLMAEQ